jgi:hypothetical protein
MKQYVIDELRPADYQKIKTYLDENYGPSTLDGIYWIALPVDHYSDRQSEHRGCQPFYFAIDLEQNMITCELLVRTKNRVRCDCISYAMEKQRNWLIGFIDRIFEKLEVTT